MHKLFNTMKGNHFTQWKSMKSKSCTKTIYVSTTQLPLHPATKLPYSTFKPSAQCFGELPPSLEGALHTAPLHEIPALSMSIYLPQVLQEVSSHPNCSTLGAGSWPWKGTFFLSSVLFCILFPCAQTDLARAPWISTLYIIQTMAFQIIPFWDSGHLHTFPICFLFSQALYDCTFMSETSIFPFGNNLSSCRHLQELVSYQWLLLLGELLPQCFVPLH